MSLYHATPGIRFNDYVFTEPKRLNEWGGTKFAGLLAILVNDAAWAPKPFAPLFFCEFGNNAPQLLPSNEHLRAADRNGSNLLLVSMLAMPFSTTTQRLAVRDQLVRAYNPICQNFGGMGEPERLARKLEELESKHEEQSTQVRMLVSSLSKSFEPQVEPKRRQIGFLAQPRPAA